MRHLRIIYWLFMLLPALSVNAEDICWPADSTTEVWWYYVWSYHDGGTQIHDQNFMKGVKVMKGKSYNLLRLQRNIERHPYIPGESGFYRPYNYKAEIVGIRFEAGRIYMDKDEYMSLLKPNSYYHFVGDSTCIPYEETPDGELILYDFNKQPGDLYCTIEGLGDVKVVSVDTIQTKDGQERRLLTLDNGLELLEGLGCLNSPGQMLFYLNPEKTLFPDSFGFLARVYAYDHIGAYGGDYHSVFFLSYDEMDRYTSIHHHQAKKYDTSSDSYGFYDLQGRRLAAPPAKGIYVKGGRKVMVE